MPALDYYTALVLTAFVSALFSVGGLLIAPALREAIPPVNRIIAANSAFLCALLLRAVLQDNHLELYEPLYQSLWLVSFLAVASALRYSADLDRSDRDLIIVAIAGAGSMFLAGVITHNPNLVRVISSVSLLVASWLSIRTALAISQANLQRPKYCLLLAFALCLIGSLAHLPGRIDELINASQEPGHSAYTYVLVMAFLMASNIGIMLTLYLRLLDRTIDIARLDHLTGVLNRRGMNETLHEYELSRGSPLVGSVISVDIDHFKRINDTYGHATGDRVLRWFSDTLKSFLRKDDILVRLGGEEFCIVLPDATAEQAVAMAQRIRNNFSEHARMDLNGQPLRVTGSFGIASANCEAADIAAYLERADEALYDAKHGGRNQVRVWSGPTGDTPAALA